MKIKYLIILTICWISNGIIYSQWIQTNGPVGKISILSILQNDNTLFIGTTCGLHSIDSISTKWNLKAIIDVSTFSKKGDTLFCGGSNSGVNLINLLNPNPKPISYGLNSMTIHAISKSDTCLYAGTQHGGFYKSNGFSDKWKSYNEGLPAETFYTRGKAYYTWYVYSIEQNNDIIFCGTHKGIFKSNVSKISWTPANSGLPQGKVQLIKSFNDTIFAGINNKLFFSSNEGDSWNEFFSSESIITSINKFEGNYYISTDGAGIFTSKNNGLSWNNLNAGLVDLHVTTLYYSDTLLVCGTSSEGLYYQNGNSWINNNKGIICSEIRTITSSKGFIIANDDKNVYINNNTGWKDITPSVNNDYFINLDVMNDTVFLCNYYQTQEWPGIHQSIIYTPDLGNSWNEITPLPYTSPFGNTWHEIYIEKSRIYAYSDEKMFFTDNLGATWTDISLPAQFCNGFRDFLIYNSIPFASACYNSQLVKLNSNKDWLLSNTGLPNDREVICLAKTTDAIYAWVDIHGMYISTDNGSTWIFVNNSLPGIKSFAFKDKNLFVTTDHGVFYTDNYGQNWNTLNTGLINKNVGPIVIKNDTLFIGTYGNGVWRHDIESIPLAIKGLSQFKDKLKIYPNPASNLLYVQTDLNTDYEIEIIDILGKKVFSKKFFSNGTIDISEIQIGTYIILVISNKGVLTTKLSIIR